MISIQNVSKQFGSATVVDEVSLEIETGDFCVIVGPSGSGKSTLLRMINRLEPISNGGIKVQGQDIMRIPSTELRRGMGYVIQGHGLFPHRTVGQNIATVPKLLGWSKNKIDARVKTLLDVFGLNPDVFQNKYPHQLSGGQQQRVGVARALAAEAKILLMDEPFGALDPLTRTKAQDDLLKIQQQLGITVMLVTHDMDEALRLGDKIAVMNNGRVLQYDSPQDILTHPADSFCSQFIGTVDRALKLLSLHNVCQYMRSELSLTHLAVPSVLQTNSLRDALSEMTWHGVNHISVVNQAGQAVGTVHLSDVLKIGQVK
ncbi:ABC transporter ATP-binding protein [Hydromonas duriensis]